MNEPRYTLKDIKRIAEEYYEEHARHYAIFEFIEYLSSLQEQEEQPVEYISQETHPTGTPPKIEPLHHEFEHEASRVAQDNFDDLHGVKRDLVITEDDITIDGTTELSIVKLTEVLNQLASKKE